MATLKEKLVIFSYKTVALLLLYGVLFGILGYAAMGVFFVTNDQWVAPTILAPGDVRILSLTGQLVASQAALDTVKLDRDKTIQSLAEMRKQVAVLQPLVRKLTVAIQHEQTSNAANGDDLAHLSVQKSQDNIRSAALAKQVDDLRKKVAEEEAAGLLTKTEAEAQLVTLNQVDNTLTDSQIAEVLLRDPVRQKTTLDPTALSLLSQQIQLKEQVVQLELSIVAGEQQVKNDEVQIARISKAMTAAEQTPFYLVFVSGKDTTAGFIPYDNRARARVGAPIYSCSVKVFFCKQVGTITSIFHEEEKGQKPIFNSDIRGFMVGLEMTDPEAAKNDILFLRKPFFF